jgi:hypothetical protein
MTQGSLISLEAMLDEASGVPEAPLDAIHARAMAAFPQRKPLLDSWTARLGALAATIVLGVGGFMGVQSYQSHQQAITADSDEFAEALLSETY